MSEVEFNNLTLLFAPLRFSRVPGIKSLIGADVDAVGPFPFAQRILKTQPDSGQPVRDKPVSL